MYFKDSVYQMRVAVLVSGGVDSSVALKLLKDEGHDVTAFYLKIWQEDELAYLGDCPWEEDMKFVQAVCQQLDVKLEVITMQSEYLERIVDYSIKELKAGRTPSSDVMCNQQIKFGAFFEKIDASFDKVASGHYARLVTNNGHIELRKAPDTVKDQTYFLCYMQKPQLPWAMFPIGHLQKSEVRAIAENFRLPTMARKDSQGICFLGKIKYRDFVKFHLGEKEGEIIEKKSGQKLGKHNGVWFYTIGQRQGLGLSGGPWFVSDKDMNSNTLFISNADDEERLKNTFTISAINWLKTDFENLSVKLRHGPHVTKCSLNPIDRDSVNVTLEEPDAGIAPGQFAVFYENDTVVAGSVIQH